MTVSWLVTHSGGFHADELLSTVILTRLFPTAHVLRTRDPAEITAAVDRIIYDVGRDYDADKRIFDHHQRPNPLRPDGQPYSSFGLIWHHFGQDYLASLGVPAHDIDPIHAAFDRDFVLPIDMLDNGTIPPSSAGPLSGMTLPTLLESMKPDFDDRSAQADDAGFDRALQIARPLVEAQLRGLAAKRRAHGIALEAVAKAGSSRVLELPIGMPYRAAIDEAGADHLLFVIHPRDSDWAINGIRLHQDTFEQRADLPAAWAGLSDQDLEAATGVKGAKFCHNARFIAVATSKEAILALARLAVEEAEKR